MRKKPATPVSVDCRHWSRCGVAIGGCCAVGLYGGKPSLGTCGKCDKREPTGRPGIAARVVEAAKGIVSAAVDPAPPEVQAERMAICEKCEHYTPCLAGTRHCCGKLLTGKGKSPNNPGCGCVLEVKVKVRRAKCPLSAPLWGPVA